MAKRMARFFGTDGIRGRVGKHPITAEFMLRLGWAAGKVFGKQAPSRILIGKDTRVSGYMFESALEAGLVSAGVDVALLGPMPTPAIAYLARAFRASAGIVISASHNPYQDNGVKFFSGEGAKLDDGIEAAIETQLGKEMRMVATERIGKVSRIDDAAGRYIEFCKSAFPQRLTLQGMKIALDCANGATYHIAPSVFSELGAEVSAIGTEPDGFNINAGLGSTAPAQLAEAVLAEGAQVGIALDGDGDRVIMVDHAGRTVDGDELLYIIAAHRQREGRLEGGVVGTQMSNFGLEEAFKRQKIDFARAAVGDRHVLAELQARGWALGGESSGHLLCLDLTTTGDGIISALQALAAMQATGQTLQELTADIAKYPQQLVNVPCQSAARLSDSAALRKAIAAAEKQLAGRGRVLIRPSGTEPVLRIMVEGEDPVQVETLLQSLATQVKKELA